MKPIDPLLERNMYCSEVYEVTTRGVLSCSEAGIFQCAQCGRRVCLVHLHTREVILPYRQPTNLAYCSTCDKQVPRSPENHG